MPSRALGSVVRLAAVLIFVWYLAQVILVTRPDLRHPTDLGTDTSNYYAAGQRLADGHDLYRLRAGDRPSPQDNPPYWSGVPLLSPPPIAVLWRVLAILPATPVMEAWWGAVVATGVLFGAWLIARLRPLAIVALIPFLWGLAQTSWSGNVDAFLLVAISSVWLLAEGRAGPTGGRSALAGAALAAASAAKLTPIMLAAWLLARGHRRALAWTLAFGALIGIASLFVVGPAAYLEFLSIGRLTTAGGATPYSVGGLLRSAGAPAAVSAAAPLAVAVLGLGAIVTLRRRPRACWAVAVAAALFVAPTIRLDTLPMLLPALVPWTERPSA